MRVPQGQDRGRTSPDALMDVAASQSHHGVKGRLWRDFCIALDSSLLHKDPRLSVKPFQADL